MESSQTGPVLRYFVGVDGSPASHVAYEVITEGLLKHQDHITVAHVSNNKKDYLPFNY